MTMAKVLRTNNKGFPVLTLNLNLIGRLRFYETFTFYPVRYPLQCAKIINIGPMYAKVEKAGFLEADMHPEDQ